MSPKLGPVSYKSSEDDPFLGREMHQPRPFSEHTQETIDNEVSAILNDASTRALELLSETAREMDLINDALIEREELTEKDIEDLIGVSVHGPSADAFEVPTETISRSEKDCGRCMPRKKRRVRFELNFERPPRSTARVGFNKEVR